MRRRRALNGPHFHEAAALCFSAAESLRIEAMQHSDMQLARYLYRAALHGGSRKTRARARDKYLLMLCQHDGGKQQPRLACTIKRHLRAGGFSCRLSPGVLRYPERHSMAEQVSTSAQPAAGVSCALDGTLPSGMLSQLQLAFGPASPFWSEHSYACGLRPSPFFSYVHSLDGPPLTGFDRVLRLLHQRAVAAGFARAAQARYVEWWAHCRPHGVGHQVHFDSDNEGSGGVRNPLVSSAFYLTGGGVGGPTLVTDQRRVGEGSGLARRGWLVLPEVNRYLLFDGRLLHGVIPGRGVAAIDARQPPAQQPAQQPAQPPGLEMGLVHSEGARRISVMVAFWPHIRQRESARPAAARPFPYDAIKGCGGAGGRRAGGGSGGNAACTWPALFDWPVSRDGTPEGAPLSAVTPVPMRPIQPVWEPTEEGERVEHMPEYDECFQGA